MLENRCDLGLGICSLKEKDKYGVCVQTKTKATCVVLDEANTDKRYLLDIDTDRLRSSTEINSDLCFYENAIFEVSDINYSMKLNYQNKCDLEIRSTKLNFMKRFIMLNDQYNKNFPSDKPMELNCVQRAPYSFNEVIGKCVAVKLSELSKFKSSNCPELKQLIDMQMNGRETEEKPAEEASAKESFDDKSSGVFHGELANLERETKRDKLIKFTVCDVQVSDVVLNSIKDFSCNDKDLVAKIKTDKVSGDQLDKLKFFKMNERPIELGSRWKLKLNEQDELVDFRRYEEHLNEKIKAKIVNLPSVPKDLNLSDYRFQVNECYEKQPAQADEPKLADTSLVDSPRTQCNFLTDTLDEALDEVFSDVVVETVKHLSKDETRNNNLLMLSRLNRRSRNSTSRNGSLNARSTSERLMNSSFRKVKLGSSGDWQENEEVDPVAKHPDRAGESEKTVLVDVLFLDKHLDVQWQDNTIETDVPLCCVTEEIDNLLDKYYPGNFVEFTGEPRDGLTPTHGVIQRIKQSSNLAEVKWFYESISSSNGSDDVNNNSQSKAKPWTSYESLFNLRSSCIHFHLGDIVVDQSLITNIAKISVKDMPSLIGVIKGINVDGTAQCNWIDGSESQKKLIELVSFFDVSLIV